MLVYPEALVVQGRDAGPFTGGAPKGLLHTTEGGNFAGALSVYRDRGFWPHFTCSFERNRFDIWQHLDVTRTAKALEHPAGTAPTNSDHVVQIEIVGRAADAPRFPVPYLDGIARWMRWVERTTGVIRRPLASFVPGAPRLTPQAWHEGSGWCGHMHVPNNSHTDPGAIDIAYLLNAAAPTPVITVVDGPTFPEDHMQPHDVTDLGPLGADGNGYYDLQFDDSKIVNIIARIQDPAVRHGYQAIPRVDWQPHGPGVVRVILEGGQPSTAYGLRIWTAA